LIEVGSLKASWLVTLVVTRWGQKKAVFLHYKLARKAEMKGSGLNLSYD